MMNVYHVQMAIQYAASLHRGQYRKYTGLPYVTHCLEVLGILLDAGINDDFDLLSAAVMHDLVEDCGVKRFEIANMFNSEIADLVMEVSDVSKPEDGNRAIRKQIDREHLANASPSGKTIKLADMISNTSSIIHFDPDFAKVYMQEKKLLMPILRGGNHKLYVRCEEIIEAYFTKQTEPPHDPL